MHVALCNLEMDIKLVTKIGPCGNYVQEETQVGKLNLYKMKYGQTPPGSGFLICKQNKEILLVKVYALTMHSLPY